MLKYLLELLDVNGEIDATVDVRDDVRHEHVRYDGASITAADEHGVVLVTADDGIRVFVPWTSVVTVKVNLGE